MATGALAILVVLPQTHVPGHRGGGSDGLELVHYVAWYDVDVVVPQTHPARSNALPVKLVQSRLIQPSDTLELTINNEKSDL